MAQAGALLAARHLPQWEVIDYASAAKPDVPSGTARELAERLAAVRRPELGRPLDEIHGPVEARGASRRRRPGPLRPAARPSSSRPRSSSACPTSASAIRHDAGGSPAPYVAGVLLAARAVRGRVGLVRGLDVLLAQA